MKESRDGSGPRGGSAAIADPRFAKVHTDPRFQRMPRNNTKVSIDSRFSHMFSDKNFSDPLGLDKRGRTKKKKEKHTLQKYYKIGEVGEDAGRNGSKLDGTGDEIEAEQTLNTKDGAKTAKDIKSGGKGKAGQALKTKAEFQRKPIVASQPVLEDTSEEEDEVEEEIDLNSDDSEAEGKEDVGTMPKKYVFQSRARNESDSADEEEAGGLRSDAGSESDVDSPSSSSSSSSESEAQSDVEEDSVEKEEKVPTTSEETRRFALMNMDWEHIKAVDLLMLMRSFCPKGGRVESVTVYPSEFGIEQLKTEEVHGPKLAFGNEDEEEEEDKEIDMEKLRAYEKNKLKYYYAVVECDSKATADHLYRECDGMEFERTSNTLDLRFIPDDMKFVREPRDVAKEVPGEYKALEFETRALQHSTVKLTWDDDEPTRVKALRRKFNSDQLNEMDFRTYLGSESSEEEIEDLEVVGSPEKVDNSGNEKPKDSKSKCARDKYRSLLLGPSTEEAPPGKPGKKAGKGDVDMEVTFHTGLSELSEKLMQKQEAKKRGDETVWEAYLRKKKEKKSLKKKKNAQNSDDDYLEDEGQSPRPDQHEADPFFKLHDNAFDDPFFADDDDAVEAAREPKALKLRHLDDDERAKKREEKEQKKREEARSKAELELLLMDDDSIQGAARGFNLKSKKDKKEKGKKKKKNMKGKKDDDKDGECDDKLATANLDDPRFASLFTSHHYAIDPTNPQFRKSGAQLKILAEAQRRRVQNSEHGVEQRPATPGADTVMVNKRDTSAIENTPNTQERKRKVELSSLVRSLKRKVGKVGTDSKGKKS